MTDNANFGIDYIAKAADRKTGVVFQAITTRAHSVFRDFSADESGSFLAVTDAEAEAAFTRLDAAGLADFTLG